MAVLALCASLYIFDITPAECWQWLCNVGGGVHEKGVAVYEQNAARRAERLAARQAEEEYCAEEPADDYDDSSDEEDVPGGIPVPGWLSGVFSWGHKVTKEMEGEAEPAPVDDSLGPSSSGRAAPLGRTRSKRPRPGPSSNRWCRMPWRLPPRISSHPLDRLLRPLW